jgi:DNA-binding LacI/PurR family transcriptional regulator
LKYKQDTGRALPEDHVIMGMDGKQLLLPEYSRFPTVAVDWEQIGVAAYNECMTRIRNPRLTAKKIFLSGWFVNYPE